MSQTIKPFRATYYNPALIKDYSAVVCPPYDVISAQQLKRLRRKSPHNFSWALIADKDNYQESASRIKRWLKERVLLDDNQESLYLYEQTFKVKERSLRRFGILSLLKMDKPGIFPHEYTLSAPKKDRRRMLAAAKANLCPIFVIAAEKLNQLEKIYRHYRKTKPLFECVGLDSNLNRVWKISCPRQALKLCREVSKKRLVIADGHHRFEVAFDYFKKNKNRFKDLNYLLSCITGPQKGLVIFSTHRIVHINQSISHILKTLEPYFCIRKVSKSSLMRRLGSPGLFSMGIYHKNNYFFLRLKDKRILDKIENKLYRDMDTYVFHRMVLPFFNLVGETLYSHSIDEAIKLAAKSGTAFILRAVPLETIFEIARKGLRFPQKSTYFYPKLLSGLVIRRFEEDSDRSRQ